MDGAGHKVCDACADDEHFVKAKECVPCPPVPNCEAGVAATCTAAGADSVCSRCAHGHNLQADGKFCCAENEYQRGFGGNDPYGVDIMIPPLIMRQISKHARPVQPRRGPSALNAT